MEDSRIRPDQDDLAGPERGGDLAADQSGDGKAVIEIAGTPRIGDVKKAPAVDRGSLDLPALSLQEKTRRLKRRGVYPVSVRLNEKKGVAHHAVLIRHGVDMTLCGVDAQGFIRLFISENGGVVPGGRAAVFPGDLLTENGRGSGDHVAQPRCGLREPVIRLLVRVAGIQHVDRRDGGQVVRIRCQRFQRIGDHVPAPGVVRPQRGEGLLVDAEQDDVPGGGGRALEEPVLHPLVHPAKHARTDDRCHEDRAEHGKKNLSVLFHSSSSGLIGLL